MFTTLANSFGAPTSNGPTAYDTWDAQLSRSFQIPTDFLSTNEPCIPFWAGFSIIMWNVQ